MIKKYKRSLFIFRRDLRLNDNTALFEALRQSSEVLACFIFDPRQYSSQNAYRGVHALQFMIESLGDLDNQLKEKGAKLFLFDGVAEDVVADLIREDCIDAVFFNADYTPFSQKRDKCIQSVCKKQNIDCRVLDDLTLHSPGTVLKDDGHPYTVYTPFYKKARTIEVSSVQKIKSGSFFSGSLKKVSFADVDQILPQRSSTLAVSGGRKEALKILNKFEMLQNYKEERDFPSKEATSKLSAHHKFGTVSAREVFWRAIEVLGEDHHFIRELYWREFFTHIAFHFPHVYGKAFYAKYDQLSWCNDKKMFEAWCEGRTGFPIVDAGMRELNTTGYMHNRVRMITASFLTKDLLVDWRWGEKYFAQQLLDYDPAVNNGSWQWASSTGCDAAPYFRIFNPWLQQKKFDEKCSYIKKWIPELRDVDVADIHAWHNTPTLFEKIDYPKPLVDHRVQKDKALAMFQSLR